MGGWVSQERHKLRAANGEKLRLKMAGSVLENRIKHVRSFTDGPKGEQSGASCLRAVQMEEEERHQPAGGEPCSAF